MQEKESPPHPVTLQPLARKGKRNEVGEGGGGRGEGEHEQWMSPQGSIQNRKCTWAIGYRLRYLSSARLEIFVLVCIMVSMFAIKKDTFLFILGDNPYRK